MRHNPAHAVCDEQVVRRLIAENPWATLISSSQGELVASHYPVLLDEDAEGLAVVTHMGRPDEQVHGFDDREVLLIVAGPHGYVSPSWYAPSATPAPTWNFSVAHCYGLPQLMTRQQNLRTPERLVAHFEQHVDHPSWLDPEIGARLAPGTVGIRIPITRFICKVKMSQNKASRSRRQILAALRQPGPVRQLRPCRRDGTRTGRAGTRVTSGDPPLNRRLGWVGWVASLRGELCSGGAAR